MKKYRSESKACKINRIALKMMAVAVLLVMVTTSCKKSVTSVTLNKTTLTLVEGESETLMATVQPDKAADKAVNWSSSNSAVATVLPSGLVSALSKGTTIIQVSTQDGNKTANCVVTVVELVPVTGVTLNKHTLVLEAGEKETLIATILPADANKKAVTWTSSNSAIATVVEGLVTAKADGTATITVTTKDGNKTDNCIVKVGYFHPAEPELIFVEGGTFTMGCTDGNCYHDGREEPAHQVTVSSFKIAKYPVTQKQWVALMGTNPSSSKGDDLPVTNVSWHDAQEFIRRLNDTTGKQYSLPTEAEWEYAARGGNKSKGYKYSGSNDIDAVAWHPDNSNNTHTIGTKAPNELGIYDMSGNVYEWCTDWYSIYTNTPQNNPTGPAIGTAHAVRGGSWYDPSQDCRVSYRGSCLPDYKNDRLGLRLVLP